MGSTSLRIFDTFHGGDSTNRPARIKALQELQRATKPKWLTEYEQSISAEAGQS